MRAAFSCAAASYDAVAVLARETGRRLAERLDWVNIAPARVADIGCATGDGIRELQRRYPQALPLALDFALPMLSAVRARTPAWQRLRRRTPRLVNADVRALPVAAGSLDLIWSNLLLHWFDDPRPVFAELLRSLDVGGLLTFTMLGPDTLGELRELGAGSLRRFLDMHDVGDMLLAAGFADPVMDREIIRFSYARPRQLLADQRQLGVRDDLLGSMPWRQWRQVLRAWQRHPDAAGGLPASFEVIFGHAWKPAPDKDGAGRSIVHFYRR